ncbi:MAG TPA: YfhO family protein [Candidatus Obscuribacterales bacterium]
MGSLYREYRHAALVILISAAAFVAYFSPVLFTGKLLAPSDALTAYVPAFMHGHSAWDLLILCGFPYLADPQVQAWYPTVLLRPLGVIGWNMSILMPYVVAAAAMYGYVFSLTRSRLSGCISAVIFSMSGVLIGNMRHQTMIHTVCWLPLLTWAFWELKRGFTLGWFTIAAATTALMTLAGFPQSLAYNLTLAAAYVLTQALSRPQTGSLRPSIPSALAAGGRPLTGGVQIDWRYMAACLGAVIIGIGICAIQLVPTAELVKLTPRLAMGRAFYDSFRFDPFQLILFVFPCLAGIDRSTLYGYDYVGPFNFVSSNCYLGLLPFLLIPGAVASSQNKKEIYFWLAAGVLTCMLAMGSVTPIGWAAYFYPLYGTFRAACKHLVEVSFAVAVLAGIATSAIRTQQITLRRMAALAAVPTAIFLGALAYAVNLLPRVASLVAATHAGTMSPDLQNNPTVLIPVSVFALDLAVLFIFVAKPECKFRQSALVLMLAADLCSFGQFLEWKHANSVKIIDVPAYAKKIKQSLLASHQRAFTDLGNGASYFEFPCNLASVWGIPMANGMDALIPARTRNFFSIYEGGFVNAIDISAADDHSLDLGCAKYVALPKQNTNLQAVNAQPERFIKIIESPTAFIYENRRVMPRVWLVPEVRQMASAETLQLIRHSDFEPRRYAVVEEAVPNELTEKAGGPPPVQNAISHLPDGTANVVELTDTMMKVAVKSAIPMFLVTSDALYDGWKTAVDGRPAKLYRADYMFRGVVVPAGEHTVEFRFVPTSLFIGAGISLLFLLLLFARFVDRVFRRRPSS